MSGSGMFALRYNIGCKRGWIRTIYIAFVSYFYEKRIAIISVSRHTTLEPSKGRTYENIEEELAISSDVVAFAYIPHHL